MSYLEFTIIIIMIGISVRFAKEQYTGSEAVGFIIVTLEIAGGISSNPFSVTVTPSEQSPVSAEGSIVCVCLCVERRVFD